MAKRCAVECSCGWKGKRVPHDCECDGEGIGACSCVWGTCPRDGQRVNSSAYLRELREASAKADAWWQEHGPAEMARLETARPHPGPMGGPFSSPRV